MTAQRRSLPAIARDNAPGLHDQQASFLPISLSGEEGTVDVLLFRLHLDALEMGRAVVTLGARQAPMTYRVAKLPCCLESVL